MSKMLENPLLEGKIWDKFRKIDMAPDKAVARFLALKGNWDESKLLEKTENIGNWSDKSKKDTDGWDE